MSVTGATGRGRHFLALLPDQAARERLSAVPVPEGARPTDRADLHLTLAFLGTLDEVGEARALAALEALPGGSVAVRLDRLEFWPRPKILVAGGPVGESPAATLAAVLRERLRGAGFELEDRPFATHVTLARKVARGPARSTPLLPPVEWNSGEVVLMASGGGAARPRYSMLARRVLGGPANC